MPTSAHRPAHRPGLRRLLGAASALLLATVVVTGTAGAAHAEDGYRYWNYFHLKNGAWDFSQVGPAGYQPEDGSVEAYRFGTSAASDTNGIPPRVDLGDVDFDTLCGDHHAAPGKKQVAVVLDYGTEADAEGVTPPDPRGDCADVDAKANGQQVLDDVAEVRSQDGLTCALDGYPVKGCGDPVSGVKVVDEQPVAFDLPQASEPDQSAAADQSAGDSDAGVPLWPLVGVGLLVAVIGAAALGLSRRNRSA